MSVGESTSDAGDGTRDGLVEAARRALTELLADGQGDTGEASDEQDEADGAPPASSEPAPPGRREQGQAWSSGLVAAGERLVQTAGVVAAAVVSYDLASDLGRGVGADRQLVIVSLVVFAVGVVIVLTVPGWLRRANRTWMETLVRRQQRHDFWATQPSSVISPEALLGHDDVVAFRDRLVVLQQRRRAAWDAGGNPAPAVEKEFQAHRRQREALLGEQANVRLSGATLRAAVGAMVGAAMVVGGYVLAASEVNAAVAAGERRDQLVEASLALTPTDVLPVVATPITVTVPDPDQARDALALVDGTPVTCHTARTGTALEVGDPPADVDAARIVFVALPGTAACRAATGWVEPAWLVPDQTTPSSDEADGGDDGGGDGTDVATEAPSDDG